MALMRAAVYTAFSGAIEIQEVPKPTAPPGGLLLRVKALRDSEFACWNLTCYANTDSKFRWCLSV